MGNDKVKNFFIPNVTKTPQSKGVDVSNRLPKNGALKSDFKKILDEQSTKPLHDGVNLSSHAAKRLQERSIDFDGKEYLKIKDAISKLKNKGSKDSLVITDKAAYVVDVNKNKIVTAVDKGSMNENVFTKIDLF